MNHVQESTGNPSKWVITIRNKIAFGEKGQFCGKDSLGIPIIIEWECVDPCSPRLSETIQSLSELLVTAYTRIELEFVQQYPDAIKSEMFLKTLEPLFENGIENIDWKVAEDKIRNNLQRFLTETDWTKFSTNNEIHLFSTIKDVESQAPLGMIQFIINSEYDYGNVKVALYDGVMPLHNNRNLHQILMSMIYKLIPNTERIFLHSRITNEKSINNHIASGFTKFPGPLMYWVDLEYKSEYSDILQRISKTINV